MKKITPTVLVVGEAGLKPSGVSSVVGPVATNPNDYALVVASATTSAVVRLDETQRLAVEQAVAKLDFASMPAGDVVQLGHEAERELHRTLDGFLSRLDKGSASRVFALFDRLEEGVEDADLPKVLKKVQRGGRPGLWTLAVGKIRGKKPAELAHQAYEVVRGVVAGKTKTLSDCMIGLERELGAESQRLFEELQQLERLKVSYGEHLGDFAMAVAVTQGLLEKARVYVASETEQVMRNPDALAQVKVQELQQKLQLLESRALALEGTYTRLPADQLVIQNVQAAGVTTLQEAITTAGQRFGNIKMTLLALHGTFAVKNVQQVVERQAAMDKQLQMVRGSLMKEVVTAAANAPGENRLAQATQIENLIAEVRAVRTIITNARVENERKFADARGKFKAAREELARLS